MYTYLIVDDEMIERKGIRMLLSRMNIRENILEASNGEEALEVFEKEKIDVLLTDINMPFMDGIELLSRIHEEYPGTETVIFSGYDEFSCQYGIEEMLRTRLYRVRFRMSCPRHSRSADFALS